jgi:hypothetical protein
MSKKPGALHSKNDSRRASATKRADTASAERLAVRAVLAKHDISKTTKKAIEDLAVIYEPALKRLADR